MPAMQIVAIVLGLIAAGYVFLRSWRPGAWWFDSIEAFLKAGVAFVCVVGAIWLVTLIDWDRGRTEEKNEIAVVPPTVTVVPEPTPPTPLLPTATNASEPTPTPSPEPTPTVAVPIVTGLTELRLDLGDCADQPNAGAGECPGERGAAYVGWGRAHGPWNGMPFAPGGDSTLRDMQLGRDNQIIVDGLASADFRLTVVTGDGACDDSFQILVGDRVAYEYRAYDPAAQTFETHVVSVPSSAIQGGQLTITFRNIATDSCGLAGVFNVSLEAG